MENFGKTAYIIGKLRKKYVGYAYQTIFLSTFWYHKYELEIARFGAYAPRAGAVDVKRLMYANVIRTYGLYFFLRVEYKESLIFLHLQKIKKNKCCVSNYIFNMYLSTTI